MYIIINQSNNPSYLILPNGEFEEVGEGMGAICIEKILIVNLALMISVYIYFFEFHFPHPSSPYLIFKTFK